MGGRADGNKYRAFQSLFYWTSFKNNDFCSVSPQFLLVSILVLLDFIQKLCDVQPINTLNMDSFNPCFIGLHSKTSVPCVLHMWADSFNPCFIGLHSKTWGYWPRISPATVVSILVLLDFIQKLNPSKSPKEKWACFNPCFIGLHSKTCKRLKKSSVFVSFNPCFIGLHSKTNNQKIYGGKIESFNPCFIGLHSKTFGSLLWRDTFCRFQSLFYWTSFKNLWRIDDWI